MILYATTELRNVKRLLFEWFGKENIKKEPKRLRTFFQITEQNLKSFKAGLDSIQWYLEYKAKCFNTEINSFVSRFDVFNYCLSTAFVTQGDY